MENYVIPQEDKKIIRELAKKQLEYANLPIMQERTEKWYKHNDLLGDVPMIHVETETFEQDILPELKCGSEAGKAIEINLQRNILNHEMIQDDRVVPKEYSVGWGSYFRLFDIPIEREHSKDSSGRDLGHVFKYKIANLEKELPLLKESTFGVDREGAVAYKVFVNEILGDILPVTMKQYGPDVVLSQRIVQLMGMETMIYSLIDYPEEFHFFMEKMTEDFIKYFEWMEKEELLLLNNGNNDISQGTFGFNRTLTGSSEKVSLKDLWAYMDSQEIVSISPEMFEEFFFPYYERIAKRFGLINYGCCEPVHPIWEKCISKLKNVRKVSISPWCNEEYMGEALSGSKVIFHRKPSPNFIGVGKELDEEAFRDHVTKTLKAGKGCKLEFSFRDIYTLDGGINKPKRAVEILRQQIERHY